MKKIISAAEKNADEIGRSENSAVDDACGILIAEQLMDIVWIGSIKIRIKEAFI